MCDSLAHLAAPPITCSAYALLCHDGRRSAARLRFRTRSAKALCINPLIRRALNPLGKINHPILERGAAGAAGTPHVVAFSCAQGCSRAEQRRRAAKLRRALLRRRDARVQRLDNRNIIRLVLKQRRKQKTTWKQTIAGFISMNRRVTETLYYFISSCVIRRVLPGRGSFYAPPLFHTHAHAQTYTLSHTRTQSQPSTAEHRGAPPHECCKVAPSC